MKIISIHKFKIPEFLLTALYDGDITDFDENDLIFLRNANEIIKNLKEKDNQYIVIGKPKKEKYFTHNPDFIDLGCDVYDINVTVLE